MLEGLNMNKKKYNAFTMLELVMVIVVLGILAALALPRMERDIRQEAADNILSAIRYTQHLALMDNVVLPTQRRWQRSFWRFGVQKCKDNGYFYTISSDKSMEGNIDLGEEALDPINGLMINGDNGENCMNNIDNQNGSSPNIFITKKYGISFPSGVTFANCGTAVGRYIGFDYLGRTHRGFAGSNGSERPNFSTLLHSDCNITFSFDDSSINPFVITIEKETGHAFIVGQPDS